MLLERFTEQTRSCVCGPILAFLFVTDISYSFSFRCLHHRCSLIFVDVDNEESRQRTRKEGRHVARVFAGTGLKLILSRDS
jgi:hypothetical protein